MNSPSTRLPSPKGLGSVSREPRFLRDWLAKTAPEEMLAAVTAFLAPYRKASARRNAVAADSRVLR